MHGLGLRRIVLAMTDTRSCAHALDIADLNDGARARAVLVRQGAFEHVSDDFHIAVRVSGEAGAGNDAVLVDHSEIAELHVLRIIVVTERKGVTAVEPTKPCVTPSVTAAVIDHMDLLR